MKLLLQNEFENYTNARGEFLPYYPGMNILTSYLFREQLRDILGTLEKDDLAYAKSFELYLETVIVNMHTKAKKYKQSRYFNDASVKDIDNQGYTIPFYNDEKKNIFVLLGIVSFQG